MTSLLGLDQTMGQLKKRLRFILDDTSRTTKLFADLRRGSLSNNDMSSSFFMLQEFIGESNGKIGTRAYEQKYGMSADDYVKRKINKTVEEGYRAKKQKSKKGKIRKSSTIRLPWFVVELDNTKGTFKIISTKIFGISSKEGWRARFNLDTYPLSKMQRREIEPIKTGENDRTVFSESVGKVCDEKSTVGEHIRKRCKTGGRNDTRYVVDYSSNKKSMNLYKNGSGGIGVKQLLTIILGQGSMGSKAKARSGLLELKRNGDYGQILACMQINKDKNIFLVPSVTPEMAVDLRKSGSMIDTSKIIFNNTIFWSVDRPACMLALLLRVPFVRTKLAIEKVDKKQKTSKIVEFINKHPNVGKVLEIMRNFKATTRGESILRDLMNEYIVWYNSPESTRGLPTDSKWYLMICVIDTAHDFGASSQRAKEVLKTIGQRTMIKDVMKSTAIGRVQNAIKKKKMTEKEWGDWVENVWSNTAQIEDAMGAFISYYTAETKYKGNEVLDVTTTDKELKEYTKISNTLMKTRSCIVFDAGKPPSGPLISFTALISAKHLDPS